MMRDSITATAPFSVRKFSIGLVRRGRSLPRCSPASRARDRHLGERGEGDARERERRARRGAEQEPGRARQDDPRDEEVG